MYEELNGAGEKRSGVATMIDVETLLEGFLNMFPKICLTCSSIRVSRFSAFGLKEFYSIRYGSDNFGVSISNTATTRFYFSFERYELQPCVINKFSWHEGMGHKSHFRERHLEYQSSCFIYNKL